MARPKEFDRDITLKKAIGVFCEHGYEGTSTDALLVAMGISRQSMYDTYGDKRRLYLEALQRYQADSVADHLRTLDRASSPVKGLEALLISFASRPPSEALQGCMGVNAICEFGRSDQKVNLLTDAASQTLDAALERLILEAKGTGEIDPSIEVRAASQFLQATLAGMKVSARAGATAETLHAVARMAIRGIS
ncbi:MAG: regulatory protein TetR [Cyanobacteria bacterium RYN_339]|nr:regulatory protein TetR [Cyanobacteria bacterium RYN_339]